MLDLSCKEWLLPFLHICEVDFLIIRIGTRIFMPKYVDSQMTFITAIPGSIIALFRLYGVFLLLRS